MARVLNAIENAQSYEAIQALYERCKPIRKGSSERSLSTAGKPYVGITKDEANPTTFRLRYHATDVVIWSLGDDGAPQVTVTPWPTLSTTAFAEAFTPWTLRFTMHLEEMPYVVHCAMPELLPPRTAWEREESDEERKGYFHCHVKRLYAFSGSVTFKQLPRGDALAQNNEVWLPTEGHEPWTFVDPSPQLMHAARVKSRYADFAPWMEARLTMENHVMNRQTHKKEVEAADLEVNDHGVLGLLADPNKWHHLLAASIFHDTQSPWSVIARRESIKRELLTPVYRAHNAVLSHDVPYLTGEDQFTSQRRLRVRYPWVA